MRPYFITSLMNPWMATIPVGILAEPPAGISRLIIFIKIFNKIFENENKIFENENKIFENENIKILKNENIKIFICN